MNIEDPRRSGRASQHPNQPPRASFSRSRWREVVGGKKRSWTLVRKHV